MALYVELLMFGGLPIAFALWQIRDVRREQRLRAEQCRAQQSGAEQGIEQGVERPATGGGVPADRG
jgi:hypothetical protein